MTLTNDFRNGIIRITKILAAIIVVFFFVGCFADPAEKDELTSRIINDFVHREFFDRIKKLFQDILKSFGSQPDDIDHKLASYYIDTIFKDIQQKIVTMAISRQVTEYDYYRKRKKLYENILDWFSNCELTDVPTTTAVSDIHKRKSDKFVVLHFFQAVHAFETGCNESGAGVPLEVSWDDGEMLQVQFIDYRDLLYTREGNTNEDSTQKKTSCKDFKRYLYKDMLHVNYNEPVSYTWVKASKWKSHFKVIVNTFNETCLNKDVCDINVRTSVIKPDKLLNRIRNEIENFLHDKNETWLKFMDFKCIQYFGYIYATRIHNSLFSFLEGKILLNRMYIKILGIVIFCILSIFDFTANEQRPANGPISSSSTSQKQEVNIGNNMSSNKHLTTDAVAADGFRNSNKRKRPKIGRSNSTNQVDHAVDHPRDQSQQIQAVYNRLLILEARLARMVRECTGFASFENYNYRHPVLREYQVMIIFHLQVEEEFIALLSAKEIINQGEMVMISNTRDEEGQSKLILKYVDRGDNTSIRLFIEALHESPSKRNKLLSQEVEKWLKSAF